jgi:hypothetical protein
MYQGLRTLAKDKGSFVTYSRLFSALGRNSEKGQAALSNSR